MNNNTGRYYVMPILIFLFAWLVPGLHAQEISTSFLKLEQASDNHLQGSWNIQYADILRVINMDADSDNRIQWWEVTQQRETLQQLLQQSVSFYSEQSACKLNTHLISNEVSALGQMLSIDFTVDCNNRPATEVSYSFLSDVDPLHYCIYEISQLDPGEDQSTIRGIMSVNDNRAWLLDAGKSKQSFDFLLYGVKHSFTSWDHLAFVFLLALAGVTTASITTARHLNPNITLFNQLAICVSLFALGHSVTLALTSLADFAVPNRITESIIALSVAWTAWLIIKEKTRPENWLVFVFGSIHGLGFSPVLMQWSQSTSISFMRSLGHSIGFELGLLLLLGIALLVANLLSRTEVFQQSMRSATLSSLLLSTIYFADNATHVTSIL